MGYQLWKSPITGYRRKGTRLSEVRALFEQKITTNSIYEPLLSCPSDAPAQEMFRLLTQKDFDVAGVKQTEYGNVTGYVDRLDLKSGIVSEFTSEFTLGNIIAESTPMADLFSILRNRDYVFVLSGGHVAGIVARADLNKPPVRIYLFGLISLMEMHMTYWIRHEYGAENWMNSISKSRLISAQKIL